MSEGSRPKVPRPAPPRPGGGAAAAKAKPMVALKKKPPALPKKPPGGRTMLGVAPPAAGARKPPSQKTLLGLPLPGVEAGSQTQTTPSQRSAAQAEEHPMAAIARKATPPPGALRAQKPPPPLNQPRTPQAPIARRPSAKKTLLGVAAPPPDDLHGGRGEFARSRGVRPSAPPPRKQPHKQPTEDDKPTVIPAPEELAAAGVIPRPPSKPQLPATTSDVVLPPLRTSPAAHQPEAPGGLGLPNLMGSAPPAPGPVQPPRMPAGTGLPDLRREMLETLPEEADTTRPADAELPNLMAEAAVPRAAAGLPNLADLREPDEAALPPVATDQGGAGRSPFDSEAPTRNMLVEDVAAGPRAPAPSIPDATDEPTVLVVGADSGLLQGLTQHLARYRVYVEKCEPSRVLDTVLAAAPDMICLMGDAAEDGGRAVLDQLAKSTMASVVPVALVSDDPALGSRLKAFRHGAAAVIPRSASVDALAERVSQLAREIPERDKESLGSVGDATLSEFVDTLASELRSGILSVRGKSEGEAVRLVLGRGRPLTNIIDEFVERVQSQVVSAEPLQYEFEEAAAGTVQLLGIDSASDSRPTDIKGIRLVLVDDDSARADAVAQVLREHGAQVMVTDLQPSEAHLGRLRHLDPTALVIGESHMQGAGYGLVKRLRSDRRLRWAAMLVVDWNQLWSEQAGVPATDTLLGQLSALAEPERTLSGRLNDESAAFDTRLESMGPARLLRVLVQGQPLRATVRNPRYYVQLHIAEGLVAGAVGFTKEGAKLEGPAALSAMLNLGSGRVRIEPGRPTGTANMMSTAEVALNMADDEVPRIPESMPAPAPVEDDSLTVPRLSDSEKMEIRDIVDAASQEQGPREPMATHPSRIAPTGAPPAEAPVQAEALGPAFPPANKPASSLSPPAPGAEVEEDLAGPSASGPNKLMLGMGVAAGAVVLIGGALGLAFGLGGDDADSSASTATPPASEAVPAKTPPDPSAPSKATATPAAATPSTTVEAPAPATSQTAEAPKAEPEPPEPPPSGVLVDANIDTPSCSKLTAENDPPSGKGAVTAAIKSAKRAIVAGKLDRAQIAYCQALAVSPDNASAASGLALVLLMRGDGKQAVTYAELALKAQPQDDTLQLLLADAQLRGGNLEAAKGTLLDTLGLDADASTKLTREAHRFAAIATEALKKRNYTRAERFYRRAHLLAPKRADAVAGMARAYMGTRRHELALPWARRAAAMRPKSAAYQVLLGDALEATGDASGAKAAFAKALELDPRNAEARSRNR